jgi:hypothetical protein
VQAGPGALDARIEGWLGRPLLDLEWRVDVRLGPSRDRRPESFPPPFLVVPPPDGRPYWQGYEPLKTRRLPEDFRTLARQMSGALEGSDETAQTLIQAFVARYGFLREPDYLVDANGESAGRGEALFLWKRELARFQAVTTLWSKVSAASTGSELARRELEVTAKVENGIRTVHIGTEEIWGLDRDFVIGRRLTDVIASRLRDDAQKHATVSLAPLISGKPLRFRPDSLLSAVYLDFGMELVGGLGARLRDCDYCHNTYRASRSDSRYCSSTCRSQARHTRRKS